MSQSNMVASKLAEYGVEQYVPANALNVDGSYQRPCTPGRVRKIAQNFDPELAGRLVVSARADGGYFVVDGQHRLVAMQSIKIGLVPCIVYAGWTVEREAEMFRILNTDIKQPTHYERHRAGLRAGHSDALEIDAIVREAGCHITERNSKTSPNNNVAAIQSLYSIYRSKYGGPVLLRRTLETLVACFGGQEHAFLGDLITGMAYFLWRADQDPRFDEKRLRTALRESTSPIEILQKTRRWREDSQSKYGAISFVLRDTYNKGLRGNKLAPWADSEWGAPGQLYEIAKGLGGDPRWH